MCVFLMEPDRVGGSPLGVVEAEEEAVVVVVAIGRGRGVVGFVVAAESWSVVRDPGGDEIQCRTKSPR